MSYVYCASLLGVIGFQVALILGAPWGRITQGGQVDGPLPRSGRVIAAVSIVILICMALAILSTAGRWPGWPTWTGWAALGMNTVMMILNWITKSVPERRLWGPITTALFGMALAVHLA